jgi:hypothetical protein
MTSSDLQQSPGAVLGNKADGIERLIKALRWLPES